MKCAFCNQEARLTFENGNYAFVEVCVQHADSGRAKVLREEHKQLTELSADELLSFVRIKLECVDEGEDQDTLNEAIDYAVNVITDWQNMKSHKDQVVNSVMGLLGFDEPVKCPVCGKTDCAEYAKTGNCSNVPWKEGYRAHM